MSKKKADNVIVRVFRSNDDARSAIAELQRSGFSDDEVGLLTHDANGDAKVETIEDAKPSRPGAGAAVGAAAGAGGGALWAIGIAAGVLPAIGPVIAGGLFAAVLASAVGGAVGGGVVGMLIGLGVKDDDARFYETEFHAGHTIVVVDTDAANAPRAMSIMQRFDSYDRLTAPVPAQQSRSVHTHI
jgi:hypothetical protein